MGSRSSGSSHFPFQKRPELFEVVNTTQVVIFLMFSLAWKRENVGEKPPPKKELPLDGAHGNSGHLNTRQFVKGNESNLMARGEVSGWSLGLWRTAYWRAEGRAPHLAGTAKLNPFVPASATHGTLMPRLAVGRHAEGQRWLLASGHQPSGADMMAGR